MLTTLSQATPHLFGFEGTVAETIFIACFSGMVIIALMQLKLSLRHWILAAILFATALTAPLNLAGTEYLQTWLLPLQVKRAEIHLGFGLLLLLTCIGSIPARWLSAQAVLLLIIPLYGAMLRFYHDDLKTGVESVGLAVGALPAMVMVIPRICSSLEGSWMTVRTFMWVSIIWIFCCSVQFIINPQFLVNSAGRFWGMLGNAQQAAILCSTTAVLALGLLLYDDKRRLKPLWIGVLAMNLLFVMWTASRTGALATIVGVGVLLLGRGGRSVLLLPAAGVLVFLLFTLANALGIQDNLDRFTGGEDTRTMAWADQIRTGLANPLFGVGLGQTFSENSYLNGFASYGIVMLVLLLVFTWISVSLCLRIYRGRHWLSPQEQGLMYVTLSWHAMYFACAFFEGFMVGRSSNPQIMMFMFAGVALYLRNRIEDEQQAAAEQGWHHDPDAYGHEGYGADEHPDGAGHGPEHDHPPAHA